MKSAAVDRSKAEIMRRLRLGHVRRLLRARWGPILPDDDCGREDLRELLLAISVGPHAEAKMPKAIEIHAPWMCRAESENLIDQVNRTPIYERKLTAKEVGKRHRVTNQDRERLRLWTIAPCDVTAEQLAEQRKAKKRERMFRLRQKRGRQTRKACLAAHSISRNKPWLAEGISRRSWYRKRGTGPCQAKLSNAGHTPVPTEKTSRP
jgi:hypothetical protein